MAVYILNLEGWVLQAENMIFFLPPTRLSEIQNIDLVSVCLSWKKKNFNFDWYKILTELSRAVNQPTVSRALSVRAEKFLFAISGLNYWTWLGCFVIEALKWSLEGMHSSHSSVIVAPLLSRDLLFRNGWRAPWQSRWNSLQARSSIIRTYEGHWELTGVDVCSKTLFFSLVM